MFSCEIYEIFKNTFFYRTSQVAASAIFTEEIAGMINHWVLSFSLKAREIIAATNKESCLWRRKEIENRQRNKRIGHWLRQVKNYFYRTFTTIPKSTSVRKSPQANISTSDQRCFNVVDQHWFNVKNETKSDVGFLKLHNVDTTSVSDFETTLMQLYPNFVSTWHQC